MHLLHPSSSLAIKQAFVQMYATQPVLSGYVKVIPEAVIYCAGELTGLLKAMGYTEQQVYKF